MPPRPSWQRSRRSGAQWEASADTQALTQQSGELLAARQSVLHLPHQMRTAQTGLATEAADLADSKNWWRNTPRPRPARAPKPLHCAKW